jgi:hypothetical protein
LHEPRAAGDEDVTRELLLQLADFLSEIALEHRRAVPLGVLEGRRDDELGHLVHLLPELARAVHCRPGLGKALIRHTPEKLRVARHQLVELELVALVTAVELERPTAVAELLRPAGILHDTVQCHELCHNQLAHGSPPVFVGLVQ